MGICLMSYVKHNLVLRGIIYIMKAHYKFHRTKTRAEVTGID
jgi:hypothetical protein